MIVAILLVCCLILSFSFWCLPYLSVSLIAVRSSKHVCALSCTLPDTYDGDDTLQRGPAPISKPRLERDVDSKAAEKGFASAFKPILPMSHPMRATIQTIPRTHTTSSSYTPGSMSRLKAHYIIRTQTHRKTFNSPTYTLAPPTPTGRH